VYIQIYNNVVYICVYMYTCIFIYTYIHISMCVCTHVYKHEYIYEYIYMNVYIHIYTQNTTSRFNRMSGNVITAATTANSSPWLICVSRSPRCDVIQVSKSGGTWPPQMYRLSVNVSTTTTTRPCRVAS